MRVRIVVQIELLSSTSRFLQIDWQLTIIRDVLMDDWPACPNNYGCPSVPKVKLPDIVSAGAQNSDMSVTSCCVSGDDVNARGEYGETALHWVVMHNNIELVDMLLGFGAKANARDTNGNTAYDLAIKYQHNVIAEKLRRAICGEDRSQSR